VLLAAFAADPRFELVEAGSRVDDATVLEAALAVHTASYLERLQRAVERGDGLIDTADNPLSPGTWEAALGAAAASLAALDDAVATGEPTFAAVRPPGHHAERDFAMGFCYLNHAALAAERAIRHHGFERVAIVDVDVHHGNGTQHLFESRADVLYASLHQHPFYPGTGAAGERGRGEGEGRTVNVPLPAGSGDEAWLAGLREIVLPALDGFRPEVLLVSAGFDAWRADPVGGMRVSEGGFAALGEELRASARRHAGGRLAALLEGGYDVAALPRLAAGFLAGERDDG
jgi:acetoin utilization deacetylase AcuC-like enzyme